MRQKFLPNQQAATLALYRRSNSGASIFAQNYGFLSMSERKKDQHDQAKENHENIRSRSSYNVPLISIQNLNREKRTSLSLFEICPQYKVQNRLSQLYAYFVLANIANTTVPSHASIFQNQSSNYTVIKNRILK